LNHPQPLRQLPQPTAQQEWTTKNHEKSLVLLTLTAVFLFSCQKQTDLKNAKAQLEEIYMTMLQTDTGTINIKLLTIIEIYFFAF
jgi:hypothetical protein